MATCHEDLVLKLFNPAFWAESRQKEAKHFDLQIAGLYGPRIAVRVALTRLTKAPAI